MEVLIIKFENWNFGKLEIWKIIWKWNFWKSNLKIGILENYLKIKVLKIGILENYLKIEVLKIKFKNWNFEELFENGSFKN